MVSIAVEHFDMDTNNVINMDLTTNRKYVFNTHLMSVVPYFVVCLFKKTYIYTHTHKGKKSYLTPASLNLSVHDRTYI